MTTEPGGGTAATSIEPVVVSDGATALHGVASSAAELEEQVQGCHPTAIASICRYTHHIHVRAFVTHVHVIVTLPAGSMTYVV